MKPRPLSPRARRDRIVLIVAYAAFCIVLTLMCVYDKNWPTDEQVQNTPNGGYER